MFTLGYIFKKQTSRIGNMNKTTRFAFMIMIVFISFTFSAAHAKVYKCVVNGKTVYSDSLCAYESKTVNINPNQNMINGDKSIAEGLPAWKKREVNDNTERSDKCSFSYNSSGDDKGETLSKAAKAECYNNELLKAGGRNDEVSLRAYNMWKDHRIITKRDPSPPKQNLHCRPDYLGGFNCN